MCTTQAELTITKNFLLNMFPAGNPLNSIKYITDLASDNKQSLINPFKTPEWIEEYEFKKDYKLQDMTPESFDKFITEAEKNSELALAYAKHLNRTNSAAPKSADAIAAVKAIKQSSPYEQV